MARDIYQEVTDQIVAQLEAGTRPWVQAWAGGGFPSNAHTGKAYRGMNIIQLWLAQSVRGYKSSQWMTFKQALEHDACVRKGEKGTAIMFMSRMNKKVRNADGTTEEKVIFLARCYTVFNVEQIDGLPAAAEAPALSEAERIAHAETFFASLGLDLRHGGGRAYYIPSEDRVQMPDFSAFRSAVDYYNTLAHETVHWTGHQSRLNRTLNRRGTQDYAFEELVAELGAAFLAAALGLEVTVREDHAAYLESWLKSFKGDKKYLFDAASKAQRAVDHLLELAGKAAASPEPGEGEGEEEPLPLAA